MYTPEYCKEHFKYINRGSSRTVYEFDDNHVIKVPRNDTGDGEEQNTAELEVYNRYHNQFPLCYLDPRSNEQFIIMEKVQPLNEIVLGDMTDDNIDKAFYSFARCNYNLDDYKSTAEYLNNPCDIRFMNFLLELSKNRVDILDAVTYDVCSFNLGLKGDRILMLDYGMFMSNYIKTENEEKCLTE